ncbi:MAG TPA: OmpA family protein, partial [Woeseiaceae bacterium]|nr:OmpA family protein [Woeseiaceae bacterium]
IAETLMVREPSTSENAGYVLNLRFDVMSAQLSSEDRAQLDELIDSWKGVRNIQIAAVGHSDGVDIAPQNRHLFADNYVLSRARANTVANYLAQGLNVPESNIQVEGRGPDDPRDTNETAEGRQANRRVELVLSGQRPGKQSYVRVKQGSSGTLIAETRGLLPGSEKATAQMLNDQAMLEHLTPPPQVLPHVNSLADGTGWVLPDEGYRPAIPAVRIALQHRLDQQVALFVNGAPVNPLNFDGVEVNTRRTVAVSRWAGVDLVEGPNTIVAEILSADGSVVERLDRSLHYAGPAVRGELVSESSVLVADGRVRPLLAVRLFDRFGQPARQTSVGAFRVDNPYRAWWQVENERKNEIVSIGNREPLYTVGKDGIALIELEPTTSSGMAVLHLKFDGEREQEIRSWLEPEPRDWILVGFGEGTAGYNTLSDNAEAAMDAGNEEGFYEDGRLAFFAKGRIKGEFLMTIAYDSARDTDQTGDEFLTNVNPNEYYTLYGDNTEQRFEAPSQRKLYLKLERRQFVALFGDFDTGLSTTELTRYERRFNGIRSEYQGEHVSYNVFATETDQSFTRDEVQGDGTSGLYRLSRAPIIGNSETVRIEVRDRFDPARVLSSQAMNRYLDYNIDYLDGTIFFKQPVPSRDAEFNLVYIVAEYESETTAAGDVIAGGRATVRTAGGGIEVGLSYIDDGQQAAPGDMTGVDLRWQATDGTLIRAELAESNTEVAGSRFSGSAEALIIEHRSEHLDLNAYHREIDQDFGLGQQSTAERGVRKYGVDGRLELNDALSVNAQASMQENLETGAERRVADADVMYRNEFMSANVGLVYAEDELLNGETLASNLVDAGISQQVFDSALTLRLNGSYALGGEAENNDYLSRVVVGADYAMLPGVDVITEYEHASGEEVESTMTRVGVRATPWHRAQINSSINNEMHEYGPRLFATVGLIQGLQINERWAIDFGVDQTRTLKGTDLQRFDDERELASGSLNDDFVAVFLGAMYQAGSWSTNSRIE